jgi:hypothetical protein
MYFWLIIPSNFENWKNYKNFHGEKNFQDFHWNFFWCDFYLSAFRMFTSQFLKNCYIYSDVKNRQKKSLNKTVTLNVPNEKNRMKYIKLKKKKIDFSKHFPD